MSHDSHHTSSIHDILGDTPTFFRFGYQVLCKNVNGFQSSGYRGISLEGGEIFHGFDGAGIKYGPPLLSYIVFK